eukprot:2523750-Rhodomonas_salina.1
MGKLRTSRASLAQPASARASRNSYPTALRQYAQRHSRFTKLTCFSILRYVEYCAEATQYRRSPSSTAAVPGKKHVHCDTRIPRTR